MFQSHTPSDYSVVSEEKDVVSYTFCEQMTRYFQLPFLGPNFSEIWWKIQIILKSMNLKMSSSKSWLFCLGFSFPRWIFYGVRGSPGPIHHIVFFVNSLWSGDAGKTYSKLMFLVCISLCYGSSYYPMGLLHQRSENHGIFPNASEAPPKTMGR